MTFQGFANDGLNNEIGVNTTRFSNEGRFVLGTKTGAENKANCQSVLRLVNGEIRCFIIAKKKIQRFDILYMDYGRYYDEEARHFCMFENITDFLLQTS